MKIAKPESCCGIRDGEKNSQEERSADDARFTGICNLETLNGNSSGARVNTQNDIRADESEEPTLDCIETEAGELLRHPQTSRRRPLQMLSWKYMPVIAVTLVAVLVHETQPSLGQEVITLDNATLVEDDDDCDAGYMGFVFTGIEVQPKGLITFVLFFLVYLMWGMTFVVERVLLPAVHMGLAQGLRLPDSFASPALLAIGGCSVPIFFLNVLSMSRTESSAVGVGLALGSAALNFFMVLPVCHLVRGDGELTYLYWWPLVRDLSVCIVASALLALFWFRFSVSWSASVNARDAACWLGQEAECCYQGIWSNPERLAPVEYGILTWYEGIVLLLVYVGFLILMRVHHRIKYFADRFFRIIAICFCASDSVAKQDAVRETLRTQAQLEHAKLGENLQKDKANSQAARMLEKMTRTATGASSLNRTAGILQLLASNTFLSGSPQLQRASAIMIMRQKTGDSHSAYQSLMQGRMGRLSREALLQFVKEYDVEIIGAKKKEFSAPGWDKACDDIVSELLEAIRTQGGHASEEGFKKWFVLNEARLIREINSAFDLLDELESGSVSVQKLASVLQLLGCHPSKEVVRITRDKLEIESHSQIGRLEFNEWYRACMAYSPRLQGTAALMRKPDLINTIRASMKHGHTDFSSKSVDDGSLVPVGGLSSDKKLDTWGRPIGTKVPGIHIWYPDHGNPDAGRINKFFHILGLPIRIPIYLTTVVCTGPAEGLGVKGGVHWLLMAIFWLALLTWGVLFACESITLTLNIPSASLGSTILALGLNASHIISSILRAVLARGDAGYSIVRSLELSIKGNIFDLLVSLPFAWLIANAARGHATHVGASNIGTSFIILCVFLLLLLILWTSARWRVNRLVAVAMMALYVLFILQDVLLADWEKAVPSYVYCSGCSDSMVCAAI